MRWETNPDVDRLPTMSWRFSSVLVRTALRNMVGLGNMVQLASSALPQPCVDPDWGHVARRCSCPSLWSFHLPPWRLDPSALRRRLRHHKARLWTNIDASGIVLPRRLRPVVETSERSFAASSHVLAAPVFVNPGALRPSGMGPDAPTEAFGVCVLRRDGPSLRRTWALPALGARRCSSSARGMRRCFAAQSWSGVGSDRIVAHRCLQRRPRLPAECMARHPVLSLHAPASSSWRASAGERQTPLRPFRLRRGGGSERLRGAKALGHVGTWAEVASPL